MMKKNNLKLKYVIERSRYRVWNSRWVI